VAGSLDYVDDEVDLGSVVSSTALGFLLGAGIGALIAPPTWRDAPVPTQ
jgi:hypothetical protein